MAAIIASQAICDLPGSFTLIGEAIRQSLAKAEDPGTHLKKRAVIHSFFKHDIVYRLCWRSAVFSNLRMGTAYGLAIIVTMLMTTILFANYLY